MGITGKRLGVAFKHSLFFMTGFLFMVVMFIILELILNKSFFSDFMMDLLYHLV